MRPTQVQVQHHTNALEIWSNAYVTQKTIQNFLKKKKNKKLFSFERKNRDNPFALKISSQAKFYLQSQFLQPN